MENLLIDGAQCKTIMKNIQRIVRDPNVLLSTGISLAMISAMGLVEGMLKSVIAGAALVMCCTGAYLLGGEEKERTTTSEA